MKMFPWGRAARSGMAGVSGHSGSVLSSSVEIRQLRDVARRLMRQDDSMFDPEFFLASLSKGWEPRVVTVSRAQEVVGIMYARERVIFGVPTGVVYADGSLGEILLANPLHQQSAFRIAVETLLTSPRICGVRLRILPGSRELDAIRQLTAPGSLDVRYSRIKYNGSGNWKYHAHLPLADSYERFLEGLGSTTRRNFRYYRRRFEEAGNSLVESLSMDELRSATFGLAAKSKLTREEPACEIQRELNMVAAAHRPIAMGLRRRDGEWLSVMGGWYRPGGAVLLFQYNSDLDFGRDSLSVVLRAYVIESLIRQGLKELVIWSDTAPPLSRYVTHRPAIGVHLDVPTYPWRVARFLVSAVGPCLPRRLAYAARWIAPPFAYMSKRPGPPGPDEAR